MNSSQTPPFETSKPTMSLENSSTNTDHLDNQDIDQVIKGYTESVSRDPHASPEKNVEEAKPESDKDCFWISFEGAASEYDDINSADDMSLSDRSRSDSDWNLDEFIPDFVADKQNQIPSHSLQPPDRRSSDISSKLQHGAQLTANMLNEGLKYSDIEGVSFSATEIAAELQNKILRRSPFNYSVFDLNFFYLLAKCGNFLLPSALAQEGVQWSSSTEWFLCSISKEGDPWDISKPSELFKRLVSFAQLENDISYEKSIRLQIRESESILQKDWAVYQRNRMLLLQIKGEQFFQHLSAAKAVGSRCVSLKDKRGCLYSKNSCALDSLLFVFPHLYWNLYRQDLFGMTANGISYALKAPGAIVTCIIMQNLFSIGDHHYRRRFHEQFSNYLRVLIQDLSSFYRARGKPLPRLWDPFRSNSFININEVIWYILPRLLGAKNHTSISSQLQFQRISIRDEQLKKAPSSSHFAELVYNLLRSKDGNVFEGCSALQVDANLTASSIGIAKKLLGDIRTHSANGYQLKIVAFLGYEQNSSQTHFISGVMFRDKEARERIYVYDGMKSEGKPKGMTLFTAFKKKNSVFSIPSLLAFVVCSKAQVID